EEARAGAYAPPPRRIHFDEDGRAPEDFVEKRHTRLGKRPDRDDQPASSFGKAAPRPAGKKRFGDKKPFEKKPFGDKPRGPRRDDDRAERKFTGTPRGPRRGDAAAAERPAFAPRVRPESEKGEGAAFRGEAKRPGRNFTGKAGAQ